MCAAVAVLLLYAADSTDRAAAAVVLWYDITGSLEGWQLSWFVGWCVVFIFLYLFFLHCLYLSLIHI